MQQQPKVSVIVPVYNHESYIKKCLDSILMQETDFPFEVLIGEDCSTDRSREILKEIEPTLPENYTIYYREKNLGMGLNGNADMLLRAAKGQYLITLEGDDFWIYPGKLQAQADFLDAHEDYVAVAHRVLRVNADNEPLKVGYWDCKKKEYTYRRFRRGELPGQTATIMYRAWMLPIMIDFDHYRGDIKTTGDRRKAILLLMNGRVRCIQEKWSAYRCIRATGSSYSANEPLRMAVRDDRMRYYKCLMAYTREHGNREAEKSAGKLYYHLYFEEVIRRRGPKLGEWIAAARKEPWPMSYMMFAVFETIRTYLWRVKMRRHIRRNARRRQREAAKLNGTGK